MSENKQDFVAFFLNSERQVRRLEFLEITHSSFSRVYRIVRNEPTGATVVHEDGLSYDYEYYPLKITLLGLHTDLDSGIHVDLGDLGEIIPQEISRAFALNNMEEKPLVFYRTYRSDVLTKPMEGPLRLQIKTVSRNAEGSSFDAKAQSVNSSGTGEPYDTQRFYPLRGFLY